MEARDFRRVARERLAGNWGIAIGAAFLAALLGGLATGSGFGIEIDEEVLQMLPQSIYPILLGVTGVATTLNLVQFILGGPVQLGYCRFLLKQHDKEDCQINDLFSQFDNFGQGFLQALLRGIYIFLWSLLFIIPGIVKGYAYSMTPFIMAENPQMTASKAITASKELMDGHKGELFWLDLTFIGWSLLCLLTLGIGELFLNPYTNASHAAFYRHLTRKNNVENP